MNIKLLALVVLLTGCSHAKPYYPEFYSAGDSIDAACGDVIFERSPPACKDIGWCAQYGHTLKVDTAAGELCTE